MQLESVCNACAFARKKMTGFSSVLMRDCVTGSRPGVEERQKQGSSELRVGYVAAVDWK